MPLLRSKIYPKNTLGPGSIEQTIAHLAHHKPSSSEHQYPSVIKHGNGKSPRKWRCQHVVAMGESSVIINVIVATVVGVPQLSWTIQQTSPAVAAGNSGITLERLLLKFLQRLAGTFFGSMLAVVMALMLEVVGKDHGRHNQNHGPVGGSYQGWRKFHNISYMPIYFVDVIVRGGRASSLKGGRLFGNQSGGW